MKGIPPTWLQTMKQKKTTRLSAANEAQQTIEASNEILFSGCWCISPCSRGCTAVGTCATQFLESQVHQTTWQGMQGGDDYACDNACKGATTYTYEVCQCVSETYPIHLGNASATMRLSIWNDYEKNLKALCPWSVARAWSELQNFRWLESSCPPPPWIENSLHHSASRLVGHTQHTRLKHVRERTPTEAELPTSSSDTALSPGPTIALSCGHESRPKVAKMTRKAEGTYYCILLYIIL